MLLVASFSFGQLLVPSTNHGAIAKAAKELKVSSYLTKSTIDTAGWTGNFTPQFLVPTLEIHSYILTNSLGRDGYWFGTNGTSTSDSSMDIWSQCWVNSGSVTVSGVLFWLSGKSLTSAGTAPIRVWCQKMLPYVSGAHGCVTGTSPTTFGPSLAGAVLGQGTVTVAAADTAFTAFNWVPFASLANVGTGDFGVAVDYKAVRAAGDTAYMFCDAIGNGLGLSYSQNCVDTSAYYYVSNNLSTLDVNLSMFAVIESGGGINDAASFQGLKMTLRQGANTTFVDYAVDFNSNITLYVYDVNGKEVAKINEGTKAPGIVNTISLNTSSFAKGMYFCSLECAGGRLTKKMIVQ